MSAPATLVNGATQWSVLRQKKKDGATKLSAIKKMEVGLTPDSARLNDPVVVTITDGNHTRTLVVHHPVGVTKLLQDAWVATPIDDVETLLAFADDPSKDKKEKAKRDLRLALAVDLGFYTKKDDKICYTKLAHHSLDGQLVAQFRTNAKEKYEAAKQQARKKYLDECVASNRKPKENWSFGQTVDNFISDEVKDAEAGITKAVQASPKWADGLKKIEPVPYETKGGPLQDRPQVAVGGGTFTAKREQMVDLVYKHLIVSMAGGYAFPAKPRSATTGDSVKSGDSAAASDTK